MSARAADLLAGLLAKLSPRGLILPGKPKGPKGNLGIALRHTPKRACAAPRQTPSLRLDVESPHELAAALAGLDKRSVDLVAFVAMPGWRYDLRGMVASLTHELDREHQKNAWWGKYPPSPTPFGERVVAAVLTDLHRADACAACNATGKAVHPETNPPSWGSCEACNGSGRLPRRLKDRADALSVSWRTFERTALRHAYDWLIGHCQRRLNVALDRIRENRG